jgi:hypothetical protein
MFLYLLSMLSCFLPLYIDEPGGGGVSDDDVMGVGDDLQDAPAVAKADAEAGDGADEQKTDEEIAAEGAAAIKAGLAGETVDDTKIKSDTDAAAADAGKTAGVNKDAVQTDNVEKLAADTTAKTKTADDFALNDAQLGALKKESRERFQGLISHTKEVESQLGEMRVAQQEFVKQQEALQNILAETKTEPEELGNLLNYNLMLKTGKYEDALKIVNEHRALILKQLGREEDGVDLLADHPDLAEKVDTLAMTRAAAIELATARDRLKAVEARDTGVQTQQQQAEQQRQAIETGLADIRKWEDLMAAKDVAFSGKKAIITQQIGNIVKQYPPSQWVGAIELVYNSLRSVAPGVTTTGALPRGGAKPGPKAASTAFQAISQGLGYSS